MKSLVWDEVLSIGNDEVDADHKILVGLFNLLNQAISDERPGEYVAALLEELINATAWHFSHEERLMLEHEYDLRGEHRSEHQDLLHSIRDFQQSFAHSATLEQDDLLFLERWLTEHILVSDMKFGSFLLATD